MNASRSGLESIYNSMDRRLAYLAMDRSGMAGGKTMLNSTATCSTEEAPISWEVAPGCENAMEDVLEPDIALPDSDEPIGS